MSLYLDTSVIVALFTVDASNARADAALRKAADVIVVSNFAGTEFASAVPRKIRVGTLTASQARTAFANFDTWVPLQLNRSISLHPTSLMHRPFCGGST